MILTGSRVTVGNILFETPKMHIYVSKQFLSGMISIINDNSNNNNFIL